MIGCHMHFNHLVILVLLQNFPRERVYIYQYKYFPLGHPGKVSLGHYVDSISDPLAANVLVNSQS